MKNSEIPRCYPSEITALCASVTPNGIEPKMDKQMTEIMVAEQLAALPDYDPATLRRKYRELTGTDAAAFGPKFMQRRCAHRLQELALGGLTAEELSALDYIANHDPNVNTALRDAPRSANDTRGVVYRREYKGKVYEMKSLGNGRDEYEAKIYTSPTAVVRAITGKSHYNGVIWWGLRK